MKPGTVVIALALVVGCKKHPPAPATVGSGSSAGSAAAEPAPAGELAYDTPDAGDDPDAIRVAFHGKQLRLPAVSADGTLYADYDYLVSEPVPPPYPMQVVLRKVGTSDVAEKLPLLDENESEVAEQAGSAWQTPALTKTLEARGDAIVKRLAGFHSLAKLDTAINASGQDEPVKIGALTLDPQMLELRDGSGTVLHSSDLDPYSEGSGVAGECSYTPMVRDAHRDDRAVYMEVSYRYRDDCSPPPVYIYAWSLDPAKADPAALVRGLVVHQLAAVPAIAVVTNSQPAAIVEKAKAESPENVQLVIARDGNSAWASMTAGDAVRASDVLVKTPKGWQLAAAAWTEAKDNAAVNRDAKAGTLKPVPITGGPGDAALADAFKKLTTDGMDATASKREDLVAIGSGPEERTVGGAGFARAWNAAWKGKVTIASLAASVAPSGTTGWVTASIELQKPGYKIPFLVFAVFDKAPDGTWSLVHIHFAV